MPAQGDHADTSQQGVFDEMTIHEGMSGRSNRRSQRTGARAADVTPKDP